MNFLTNIRVWEARRLSYLYVSKKSRFVIIRVMIGDMVSFINLSLGINIFLSLLPHENSNMRNSKNLYLTYFSLIGPIPHEITKVPHFIKLYISSSPLWSPIFETMGNIRNITNSI